MRTIHFLLTILLAFSISAKAQQITVKGQVTDETNSPMVGVSIVVKGTNQGTVTDLKAKHCFLILSATKLKNELPTACVSM